MVQQCHNARELGYVRPGWFILFYKFVSFFQSSTCFPLENCIWKPKYLCEIGQGHGKPTIAGDMGNASLIPGEEDPLEGGIETHSSILAWRISWTEEPGGLQSTVMKSWTQWSDREHTHTNTHSMWENLQTIVIWSFSTNTWSSQVLTNMLSFTGFYKLCWTYKLLQHLSRITYWFLVKVKTQMPFNLSDLFPGRF